MDRFAAVNLSTELLAAAAEGQVVVAQPGALEGSTVVSRVLLPLVEGGGQRCSTRSRVLLLLAQSRNKAWVELGQDPGRVGGRLKHASAAQSCTYTWNTSII